jgi:Holliday junction resolvase
MTRLESSIMREIRVYLTQQGYYWSNLPAGVVGHRQGDPDMVACIRGKYVALEGKTETGRQSPRQKEVERLIHQSGGIYAVVRSVEDVKYIVTTIENDALRGEEQ